MTYLDAAYTILKRANKPLHYREITRRALAEGLIQPRGLTPEATMGSRLYIDTRQEGSRFVRAGRGLFDLAERQPSGIDRRVQKINQATRERLRELLHVMPPDRFEALIGELLIQMGFDEHTVQVTQRSSDGGIDVVGVFRAAGLTEINVAVQVKRWRQKRASPRGHPAARFTAGASTGDHHHDGWFLSGSPTRGSSIQQSPHRSH